MDRPVDNDDGEPFLHISSSSSSPALTYLDTHIDHSTNNNKKRQQQGFDSSAPDVLSGYEFQASMQQRRRNSSVEHASSRHYRSSGSPVYLKGELFSARKDAEMDSHNSKIVSAVERTIKKHADNILRVLEGMNGRLSYLESVTQVLERSVASLKASVDDYHGEADAKSKALNNHVVEMHRAVQILRDKQDIVETNAELAKLQASKAGAVGEKASAFAPASKQPVASSQIVTQDHLALAVVSNSVPKRSSTQPQLSSQQSNEISGQLQQLSLLPDANTLPQQPVPTQAHRLQQSHGWSQSESHPAVQPGLFQVQSQHVQTQQIMQTQQGLLQAQPQQVQVQQSVQSQQGVFQAQQQHSQTQQNVRSQQGEFQGQPQHVHTQHSVQLQQGSFHAQQQHVRIQQSVQSQEGTLQAHQQHVQTQQNVPFQQGAFQTQAHHVQPQQHIQAPQGAFQAQPQHLQIQQNAQSQQGAFHIQAPQGAFQAQPQHLQIQQSAQSQQGAFQAQQQHVQTQQSIQPHQGPQAQSFRGPVQHLQQPSPNQTGITVSQSEQGQFQVAPQHLKIQQPLSSAMGQPSVQVAHTQYGSMIQALPAQSITQLPQVQPASNPQLQTPQNNLPSQSMVGQVMVQPPQTPNAHLPVQGVPPGQGSFQFAQQIESFFPLPQATVMQAPSSSQVEYSAGPHYNVSNTDSSQQHSFYSQPILQAQDSNAYQRFPSPLQGPQLVYASQGPVTPSVTSTRSLPVAQNVYSQSLAGGPPNHLSHDDGIVDKVAAMGFSRDEAWSAIKRLTDQGQIVDMNAVLDLLMNGRNQSQRGWQAR